MGGGASIVGGCNQTRGAVALFFFLKCVCETIDREVVFSSSFFSHLASVAFL